MLGQWIGQGGGETEADQVMQPPDHNSEWSTLIGRECRDRALIGREFYIELKYFHGVATPVLLCHKEPAKVAHALKGSIIGAHYSIRELA